MKVTNVHNLPEVFVRMAESDSYSRGKSERSVTQLIDSPRVVNLKVQHEPQMIEDAADVFFRQLGTAFHNLLEDNAKDLPSYITEQRFFATVDGWTFSGAVDVQVLDIDESTGRVNGVDMQDYKMTSVWSVLNPKPAWEQQLNVYAWLYKHHDGATGNEAALTSLTVVVLIRDWSRAEAGRRPDDYPQAPVHLVAVPMWSDSDQEAYILERLRIHKEATLDAAIDEENLIECTDEEMWAKPDKYAVMNGENTRATKVLDTHEDADAYIESHDKLKKPWIDVRLGGRTRCEKNFCGVSEHCTQYKNWKGDTADG
jgi:hypothetical protein